MAKFDEADPRWIVQNRADGTNVNAWHWQEKDCTAWSKKRLAELFTDAQLTAAPRVVATGLESLSGEAFLNNRKAKLVASYELKLSVGWRGAAADGSDVTGTIEVPYLADENEDEDTEVKYLADENEDEDTEVKINVAVESAASSELRQALLRGGGREAVRKLISQYVDELKAGAPLKGAGGDDDAAAPAPAAAAAAAPAAKPAAAAAGAAAGGKAGGGSKAASSSRTTLRLEQQFYCRPSDMFECFTAVPRLCAFTQSAATAEPRPGGAFSWYGGGVSGSFAELDPPGRLVLNWRFSSWEEGVTSRVEITLTEPEPGNTIMVLNQTGIPEEDKYGNHDVKIQVERGWQEQVFKRIRQVFGFGA